MRLRSSASVKGKEHKPYEFGVKVTIAQSGPLRPVVLVDRDHPFRSIATSLWMGGLSAVG
jgi:hypothetical protein